MAVDHIDRAAENVEAWLDRRLDFDSDQGRGGIFYKYEPPSMPVSGINYVRVSKNYVEGNGWVYDTDARLQTLLEIIVRAPHVFDLGRWLTQLEARLPFEVAPLAYVVRPESETPDGKRQVLYAYEVEFGADAEPRPQAPSVKCTATFDLDDDDFESTVAAVATRLGGAPERDRSGMLVKMQSPTYGRVSLGGGRGASTRLTAHWSTKSVLDLGRLWASLDGIGGQVRPVGHEIEGVRANNGISVRLSYEAKSKA